MKLIGVTGQAGSGKDTVADRLVEEHGYVKIALADPLKRLGMHVFGFSEQQLWGPSEFRNEFDERFNMCEIVSGGVKFGPKSKLSAIRKVCDGGWYVSARALQEYGPEWLASVVGYENYAEHGEELMESLCMWFKFLGHKYAELSPRIMLQHLGTEWGRIHVEKILGDNMIWVSAMLRTAAEALKGYPYDRRHGLDMVHEGPAPAGVVVSDVRFFNELAAIKGAEGTLIRVKRPETDKKAAKTGIGGHASEMEQKSFKDEQFNYVIMNVGTLDELLEKVDKVAGWLSDK